MPPDAAEPLRSLEEILGYADSLTAANDLQTTVLHRRVGDREPTCDHAGAIRLLCELVTRREDCLTLFHLLDAVSSELREAALDRLAVLVPWPEGVTREGLLAGDEAMRLDLRAVMEPSWRSGWGYND